MTPMQAIEMHAPAVRRIARTVARTTVGYQEAEDLVQEGYLAILEMNVRPDTSEREQHAHAETRIGGAVIDALRRRDGCPRSIRSKARDIARSERNLANSLGRAPRDVEIAIAANIDLDEYFEVRRIAHAYVPPADEIADFEAVDEVYASQHELGDHRDPLEMLIAAQTVTALTEAIERLPRRLRTVIRLTLAGRTLREVGEEMGFTESRACQLQKEAVVRLRKALKDQLRV